MKEIVIVEVEYLSFRFESVEEARSFAEIAHEASGYLPKITISYREEKEDEV